MDGVVAGMGIMAPVRAGLMFLLDLRHSFSPALRCYHSWSSHFQTPSGTICTSAPRFSGLQSWVELYHQLHRDKRQGGKQNCEQETSVNGIFHVHLGAWGFGHPRQPIIAK